MLSLLLFAVLLLDAPDTMEEGTLDAGAWVGVGIENPGDGPAAVTLSLECNGEAIEEVHLEVAAAGRRVIRMDRLFAASPDGCEIAFVASRPVVVFGYSGSERAPAAVRRKRRAVRTPGPPFVSRTLVLTPAKDNTLYESDDGSASNGAGVHLFAGNTATRSPRRAVMAFDVAAQIPPGSQVTRVMLSVDVSRTVSGAQTMTLHRLSANWGEGTSNAGISRDGGGAGSRPGDATWIHTFFPDQRWITPGGDFDIAPDATTQSVLGSITWESPAMITRVQQWLDQPSTNFGWIVIGNEAASGTAKRFESREILPTTARPALTIVFNGR